MKVASGRAQDIDDMQALQQVLSLPTLEAALQLVLTYIPERLLTPKSRYLLEMLYDAEQEEEHE